MVKQVWHRNVLQLHSYFNVYIIEREEGLILVDTGIEGEEGPVLQTIETLKKPLLFIALTHAHYDHVGGTKAILNRYPAARVCMGKREIEAANREKKYLKEDGSPYDIFVSPLDFDVDIPVEGGDEMEGLLAIDAPGHTPGSVCYFDKSSGTLFAGDLFVSVGKLKVAGQANPVFPLPTKGTWNKDVAMESCRALLNDPIACLACGHGRLVFDPLESMRTLVESSA